MQKTMRLPVELTQEEKLAVSGDMSVAWVKYEEVEAEKKIITSGFTAQLKALRTKIHDLNVSYQTGTVERDVPFREEKDLFAGKVRVIRLDTGAVVSDRPLAGDERQRDIEDAIIDGGKAGGGKVIGMAGARKDLAEEQQHAETPEEAEELRNKRLAAEQAERGKEFAIPVDGDLVEVFPAVAPDWIVVTVKNTFGNTFTATVSGEDVVFEHGDHDLNWRWPSSWSDVAEESQRLQAVEAARLAAEPKAPKALLKKPKRNGNGSNGTKKNSIVDGDDKPIEGLTGGPEPEFCLEGCTIEHHHTETRTAF